MIEATFLGIFIAAIVTAFGIYYKKKQRELEAINTVQEEGVPKIKELRRKLFVADENKKDQKIWEDLYIRQIMDIVLTRFENLGIKVKNKQIPKKLVFQALHTAIIRTYVATKDYLEYMGEKKGGRYMPHFQDLAMEAMISK